MRSQHAICQWPPIPNDPWPKIVPLPWAEKLLAQANLPFSLEEIAEVLARCLQLEMRSAGECAAMAAVLESDPLLRFELQFHSRVRSEAAARLLTAYDTVYRQAMKTGACFLLSPDQLKDEGTTCYQEQFLDHCGHHLLHQMIHSNGPIGSRQH
jgi:hypothetical protein